MNKSTSANLGFEEKLWAAADKMRNNVQIPACLWFVSRDRYNNKFRDRHDEILFIDARKLGKLVDRRHRELSDEELQQISETYHNWRNKTGNYENIKGFCKTTSIEEVEKNGYVLTPGRYVGTDFVMEDDEVFEEKMARLTKNLSEQFKQSKELEQKIKDNLEKVGFKI